MSKNRQYMTFWTGVLVQALILTVAAGFFGPAVSPLLFFNSTAALPMLLVTSIFVVWIASVTFLRDGDAVDGTTLLLSGIVVETIYSHGLPADKWMGATIFLTVAFWGIAVGFFVLCKEFSHSVCRRLGW